MSNEAKEQERIAMLSHARKILENTTDSEARYHARMIRYSLEADEEAPTEMYDP